MKPIRPVGGWLNPRLRIGGLVGAILLLSLLPFAPGRSDPAPVAPAAEPAHNLDRGNLPVAFEANGRAGLLHLPGR
jgi:hypothetical protein